MSMQDAADALRDRVAGAYSTAARWFADLSAPPPDTSAQDDRDAQRLREENAARMDVRTRRLPGVGWFPKDGPP